MRRVSGVLCVLAVLSLGAAGCGSSSDESVSGSDVGVATTEVGATNEGSTDEASDDGGDSNTDDDGAATDDQVNDTADQADDTAEDVSADESVENEQFRPFPRIETMPSDPGPRPDLSWSSVEGAVQYEVVVLDADRMPYWAWTGEATSVALGGITDPDAVGAWVYQPLTWQVLARSGEGEVLAISEPASLNPAG